MNDFTREPIEFNIYEMKLKKTKGNLSCRADQLIRQLSDMKETNDEDICMMQSYIMGFLEALKIVKSEAD